MHCHSKAIISLIRNNSTTLRDLTITYIRIICLYQFLKIQNNTSIFYTSYVFRNKNSYNLTRSIRLNIWFIRWTTYRMCTRKLLVGYFAYPRPYRSHVRYGLEYVPRPYRSHVRYDLEYVPRSLEYTRKKWIAFKIIKETLCAKKNHQKSLTPHSLRNTAAVK